MSKTILKKESIKNIDFPTFKMSKKREKLGLEALKEHQNGKSVKIENINKYLDNL